MAATTANTRQAAVFVSYSVYDEGFVRKLVRFLRAIVHSHVRPMGTRVRAWWGRRRRCYRPVPLPAVDVGIVSALSGLMRLVAAPLTSSLTRTGPPVIAG
jgi:hypothetical protein